LANNQEDVEGRDEDVNWLIPELWCGRESRGTAQGKPGRMMRSERRRWSYGRKG
jgi:hypothetical protein